MKEILNFELNENQMIQALCEFHKWATGKEVNQEDRGQIASYVMEGRLNIYEVEK